MLEALLSKGYLPRELPPLFSSSSFATLTEHLDAAPERLKSAKATWSAQATHNLARVGGLRRRLAIPNPCNFFRLAKVFSTNEAQLRAIWQKSPYSRTSPISSTSGFRAIAPTGSDRATPRAMARIGARYLLRADISQFYPSIYTHTIPWAVHTKLVAKSATKDATLLGNVIDKEIQACQLGQTAGVAIGPDTSLGVAELLLSPIDEQLYANSNCKGAVRFIDDMEFSFAKLSEAESALSRLEALLYEFELQLNGNKTRILNLPHEVESGYVTKLRSFLPASGSAPPSKWIDFFNVAFDEARKFPNEGVLRYAVASLQGIFVSKKAWVVVQHLLWQCIALDSGCLRFVVDALLANHYVAKHIIDTDLVIQALDSLIEISAPVEHGSEVLWSIWAASVLEVGFSAKSQALIAQMDDACVASASMLGIGKAFDEDFQSPLWESWLVEECFLQEHWIFAYEALHRNWCGAKVKASKIDKDSVAAFLNAQGISFLNPDSVAAYKPSKIMIPVWGGGGY